MGQFVHTSWSAKDGAPGNIFALAQTADGFLWLGTAQGLYRFDGVSFEHYEPQSGPALPVSRITSLLALPNGELWIGFRDHGISRLRNGKNTNYSNSDGLPSEANVKLAQGRDGTIWAGTDGGLARFDHDQWERVGNDWGYPGGKVTALFVDHSGILWVSWEEGVLFLPPGTKRLEHVGIKISGGYQIVESPAGAPWIAETGRSVHPVASLKPEIQVGSIGILFDDDGSLWITSLGDGMRRVPFPDQLNGRSIGEFSEAIESFTVKDGLTSDYVTCILKDREGNIWVGTSSGLDRFRRGALVPILLPTKFASKALIAGDNGDIWVGSTSNALARIQRNTWTMMQNRFILPNSKLGLSTAYGLRDSRGTIWLLAVSHAVLRLEHGAPTLFADPPPGLDARSWLGAVLAVDRSGTPWVGNGPRSLFFFKRGRWEQFEVPAAFAGKRALVTFTDANDRVWFGYNDNALLLIDGSNVRTFSAKDGLAVGSVMAISGCDRHIWIGGESGLAVWEGDSLRSVVPADSDTFHGVSGVQEDSSGDVLLSEQRGVVLIPASEISKILKDRSARVQYLVFDVRDGLPGAIQQAVPYPTAVRGTDGRIWFSTTTGVAWIDPTRIPKNSIPPPVVIRSVSANGTRYASPDGLRLPPRTRDLTVDYTALSLAIPERVRFRYKLEGSDTKWQDAGTRRQAFYTNLSPGDYKFRVIASNNDGIWNETGASWALSIAPTFYETRWFKALMALTGIGLIWILYRLRLRQMTARADLRFAERLEERTRIARELHDTMLQSFQSSLLRMQAARNDFSRRPDHALEKLDGAINMAAEAITEGRNAVGDLRSSTAIRNDLAEQLKNLGGELAAGGAATFQVVVEGPPRELTPIVRDEIYRIGAEAVRNAFRHARASRVEVDLLYSEELFQLHVRDDGAGITPEILDRGRSHRYGLAGMRERARKIGGKLKIWSEVAKGTQINLSIPASVAYRASAPHSRWRLFKRE